MKSAKNEGEEFEMTVPDANGSAPTTRSVEEVRQGRTGLGVRYVLIASFIGASALLLVIALVFARG